MLQSRRVYAEGRTVVAEIHETVVARRAERISESHDTSAIVADHRIACANATTICNPAAVAESVMPQPYSRDARSRASGNADGMRR
jgi:hypothetical protein